MTFSSLLAPKWKAAAVSAGTGRALAALARTGPPLAPAVGARTPAKLPRLPAAPLSFFFFFSSGAPSPAARKPGGGAAAGAKKASPKPRKAKAGAAKAKTAAAPAKAAARKTAAAKGRLGAKKGSAAKAKAGRAGDQARAKSAKTRAVAKAKARVVAKAKARAIAKAKARAVAKARKAKAREAKAKAKARAAAKAKASRARGKKESIKAQARSILELKRAVPSRVASPLSLFYSDHMPKNVPITQGVKIALDSWNSSPESTKQAYKDKAQASLENFGRAMERWIGSLTPEQKTLATSSKFLKTLPVYKARVIRRSVRKSHITPYNAFVKAVCPELRAAAQRDRPDLAGKQLQMATFKLVGEKWRGLSDEQKKVYARV